MFRKRTSIKDSVLSFLGFGAILAYFGLWYWSLGVVEAYLDRFLPEALYPLGFVGGGLAGLIAPFIIVAIVAVYLVWETCHALAYSVSLNPTPALILLLLLALRFGGQRIARDRFQGPGAGSKILLAVTKSAADTASLCCIGVAAVICLQLLFILLTGFDRNSALYWLAFASAIKLRSITLEANLFLLALAIISAVLPTIRVVQRASRALKWWGRVKAVVAAFCAFTVSGAVYASSIAQSYAIVIGRQHNQAGLASSLPAREAAAAYLVRCLEAMPRADRQNVAVALMRFQRDPNGLAWARTSGERAGNEFADSFANVPRSDDIPEQPQSVSPGAEAGDPEDRSRSAYQAAREAAISILTEAAKTGARKLGVDPDEALFRAFVDSAIGAAAANVFDRIVPRQPEFLGKMATWLASLRTRAAGIRMPEHDLGLEVLASVRLPDTLGAESVIGWIGKEVHLRDRIWESDPDGGPGDIPGRSRGRSLPPRAPRPELPPVEGIP